MPLPSKKSPPPAPLLPLPLLLLPLLPWKPPLFPEPPMRLARSECALSPSRLPPPPPPPDEVLEGRGTAEALLARLARAEPPVPPPPPTEGLKRDSVIGGAAGVEVIAVAASMSENGGVRASGGVAGAAGAAPVPAVAVAGSAVVSEATRCSSSSSECLLLACVRLGEKSCAVVDRLDGFSKGGETKKKRGERQGEEDERRRRSVGGEREREREAGVGRERKGLPAAAPSSSKLIGR